MARQATDRTKAVWTGTGTGTITLGGAAPNEPVQAFPSSLDGQIVPYLIVHETANEAEAGYGLYTHSGTTLTRVYRYYPTPGGAAVAFSAGTKFVSPTPIAGFVVPNIATTDPTVNDDVTAGFLRGMQWINSVTPVRMELSRSYRRCGSSGCVLTAVLETSGRSGTPAADQYASFTDADTIQGRTPAQVVADIQSLLPDAQADWRGVGIESALDAFTAIAASAGGLSQVVDTGYNHHDRGRYQRHISAADLGCLDQRGARRRCAGWHSRAPIPSWRRNDDRNLPGRPGSGQRSWLLRHRGSGHQVDDLFHRLGLD